MAIVVTETFDTYTIGETLGSEGNDGTGWLSNWGGTPGKHTIQAAPAGGQGGNAVRDNTTTAESARRDFSVPYTQGIFGCLMRLNITNPNDIQGIMLFCDSTTQHLAVRFGPTGNLEIRTVAPEWTTIQAYSVDTWYRVEIEFKTPIYRARIDSGTWTDWQDTTAGFPQIDAVVLQTSATNAHEWWIDDVTLTETKRYIFGPR